MKRLLSLPPEAAQLGGVTPASLELIRQSLTQLKLDTLVINWDVHPHLSAPLLLKT
jgi:hypothetical protein